MTADNKPMTHGRLINKFKQVGPYLRQNKCSEQGYFFDCLSSCINAQKKPEKREFWGWWLELTPVNEGFVYDYKFGKYDLDGNWQDDKIPENKQDEVQKTLETFYEKLSTMCGEYSLNLKAAEKKKEMSLS